jgi:hypothetical protein
MIFVFAPTACILEKDNLLPAEMGMRLLYGLCAGGAV